MRQLATRITPNLGNHNRKIYWTTVRFSSVLWIFSLHRTEPANTNLHALYALTNPTLAILLSTMNSAPMFLLLTISSLGTHCLALVIMLLSHKDSPCPLLNLHSWPSGGPLLPTQNQLMALAHYASLSFVTNRVLLKKLACLLTTLCCVLS